MENKAIAKAFKLAATLHELHEANPFKVRSLQQAALQMEQLGQALHTLEVAERQTLLGKSAAAKVEELLATGTFAELQELQANTPAGLLDLLELKGLGPKSVKTLWQSIGITTIAALKEAIADGSLKKHKGFGDKTLENIAQAIAQREENEGKFLIHKAHAASQQMLEVLKGLPQVQVVLPTGQVATQAEIVEVFEFILASDDIVGLWQGLRQSPELKVVDEDSSPFTAAVVLQAWPKAKCVLHLCQPDQLGSLALLRTSSATHLAHQPAVGTNLLGLLSKNKTLGKEQAYYEQLGLPYIAAPRRNGLGEWEVQEEELIDLADLKGSIHNHSTYSDGQHSLRDMALGCQQRGWEYLVICDHSQTATYARGLDEEAVKRQHEEIDRLNEELAPFHIFKGIESDILLDGSLDYPDEVLASFDLVVASVHSVLNMDKRKATERLLRAISNPFTTIVGHISTRLLLQRPGFPLEYEKIIEACAQHGVVLELNANPYRLDIDWRLLPQVLQAGLRISINPDAHQVADFDYTQWGVAMARKGNVKKSEVLNTLGKTELAQYLKARKKIHHA